MKMFVDSEGSLMKARTSHVILKLILFPLRIYFVIKMNAISICKTNCSNVIYMHSTVPGIYQFVYLLRSTSTKLVSPHQLAQMVACLPLVQQVRGSIPGGVVNFNLKIFNLGARRGGDVHFLITRARVRKSGTLCLCSVT